MPAVGHVRRAGQVALREGGLHRLQLGVGRVAARLLETLQAQITAEQSSEQDDSNARDTDRTSLTASLTANVTPAWDVTVAARNEDAEVSGAGAAGVPDPSNDSYQVVVIYQPGDQLTVEADLEWLETFAGSGLDQ